MKDILGSVPSTLKPLYLCTHPYWHYLKSSWTNLDGKWVPFARMTKCSYQTGWCHPRNHEYFVECNPRTGAKTHSHRISPGVPHQEGEEIKSHSECPLRTRYQRNSKKSQKFLEPNFGTLLWNIGTPCQSLRCSFPSTRFQRAHLRPSGVRTCSLRKANKKAKFRG